jgi:hypothetical protein
MTQEEKELLLQDLSARLAYGVKLKTPKGDGHLNEITLSIFSTNVGVNIQATIREYLPLEDCKPYLRPMSSMTEEEKHKLLKFGAITCLENGEVIDVSCVGFERHADVQDYLNTCHLDYRGLIEKGLAIEAPEGMYN